MALHFSNDEFTARRERVLAAMAEAELDALLMFKQESMYWLTGYDSFGFCFFQCLVLHGDGRLVLLTRSADLRQAQETSLIEDIRVWRDAVDACPQRDLKDILTDLGLSGCRIGIELEAHGLTARLWRSLEAVIEGFCIWDDASDLVTTERMVKSPAELGYVREAALLADRALDAGVALARPGALESDILAAMQGAVFRGGGDYPGNPFIIGSGDGALLCRYFSGRRKLDERDQLTLEFAGVYRQYHSCMMRTVLIGEPDPEQVAMHGICLEALQACLQEARPGRTAGDVYAAHARVLDEAGLGAHRLNACGYSLGAVFAPSWMDKPMFYQGNPTELRAGMVLFLHMILMNSERRLAMSLGTTVALDRKGNRILSEAPLDLIVRS